MGDFHIDKFTRTRHATTPLFAIFFFFYDFLTRIATRSIVPAAVGDALNNENEKKKKKIYISPWDLDPTPRPRGPVRKKRCRGPSVAPPSSADPSNSSRITSRRDGSIEII